MKLAEHLTLRKAWTEFEEVLELSGVHDVRGCLIELAYAKDVADAISMVLAAGGSVPPAGFPSDAWGSQRHQQLFFELTTGCYTYRLSGRSEPIIHIPRAHWFQDRDFALTTDGLIETTQPHSRRRRHRYVCFHRNEEGVLVLTSDPDRTVPAWLRDEITYALRPPDPETFGTVQTPLRVTDELGELIPF